MKLTIHKERFMDTPKRMARLRKRAGRVRYGLAAWLLGLPLPFIVIALLWGGCRW